MDMNCTRLETWLADQLDPQRDELPSEWTQHIAECGSCAQCWQDERLLAAAVVAWRTKSPCPPATDALVTLLLQEATARAGAMNVPTKRRARSRWWSLVASAAVVMIGISVARSLSPGDDFVESEQLAFTSTMGSLLHRLDEARFDVLTAGPSGLPIIPGLSAGSTRSTDFTAGEIIDPAASSGVLRYGQPLGDGVGHAFRFLQIAVPVPTTDAG
ncbi:MAG TPA: hypothetical protein VFG20_12815 [Planctomycetaceae bacterium]|nr:hypothetical protein [Planctomycetaceae bacterium]